MADEIDPKAPEQDSPLSAGENAYDDDKNLPPDTSAPSSVQRNSFRQIPYTLLRFWAISVYDILTAAVSITNEDGKHVGAAWVDGVEDTALLHSSSKQPVQFMLISTSSPFRRRGSGSELDGEETKYHDAPSTTCFF